jgi:hypothetical protein
MSERIREQCDSTATYRRCVGRADRTHGPVGAIYILFVIVCVGDEDEDESEKMCGIGKPRKKELGMVQVPGTLHMELEAQNANPGTYMPCDLFLY